MVEATESLASPVSWSHHFIWVVLLVAWLALAEDRPRYGEWYALAVAVLFWAAPVLVGAARARASRFAGRGWLIPVSDCLRARCSSCWWSGRGSASCRDSADAPRAPAAPRAMAPLGVG